MHKIQKILGGIFLGGVLLGGSADAPVEGHIITVG